MEAEQMQRLYYGGTILTMDKQGSVAALLIENDRIIATGEMEALYEKAEQNVELCNLQRHTLLPSFIDSHGHILSYANSLRMVELTECVNVADVISKLKEEQGKQNNKLDQWLIGYGYDHNRFPDALPPCRYDLDKVSE